MQKQIRRAVFETNSSSSHSLTLPAKDALLVSFPKNQLRAGVVKLGKGEFGWEWTRIYHPLGKLEYLFTQLMPGVAVPEGDAREVTNQIRQQEPRFNMLYGVVQGFTGCRIELIPGSDGYVDHESLGVGMELFSDEEQLKDFIFSPDAYVQTGNDNNSPPWEIPTDRGPELFFEDLLVAEIPEGYVARKLTTLDGSTLATEKSAVLHSEKNAQLHQLVGSKGILAKVKLTLLGYDPTEREDLRSYSVQSLLRRFGGKLRILNRFQATKNLQDGRHLESIETITVYVPPEVAAQLDALPANMVNQYRLEKVQARIAWTNEVLKTDPGAQWAKSNLETLNAELVQLQKKIRAASRRAKAQSPATETAAE